MSGPAGGQCTCALSGNVCLSRCGRRPLRTTTYHTTYHPPLLPATLWTTPAAAYYHYCEATPCDHLLQLSTTVTVNTTACYRHLLLRVPTTIACYCRQNHTPPPATTTLPVVTAPAPATCCCHLLLLLLPLRLLLLLLPAIPNRQSVRRLPLPPPQPLPPARLLHTHTHAWGMDSAGISK